MNSDGVCYMYYEIMSSMFSKVKTSDFIGKAQFEKVYGGFSCDIIYQANFASHHTRDRLILHGPY